MVKKIKALTKLKFTKKQKYKAESDYQTCAQAHWG